MDGMGWERLWDMSEEEERIITIYLITCLIVIIILCIGKKKYLISYLSVITYLVLVKICDVLFSLVGFFR